MMNQDSVRPMRATTILAVRKDGRSVMAGDGQVSLGETIMKHKATKVRYMYEDKVLVGFAGTAADALNLFERLEGKIRSSTMKQVLENIGASKLSTDAISKQ